MPKAYTSQKQKNRTALLGAIVLLTIIMVFTTMMTYFSSKPAPKTHKISTMEASTFESYIAPLVILNVNPFENVSKASQDELLLSAIWSILISKKSGYMTADDNRIIIPQTDVENAYKNLYGTLPKHKTISHDEQDYEYVSDEKCYYIPVQGIYNQFCPRIVDSTQKDNILNLNVEYIPQENWMQDESGSIVPPKPNKKMVYVIEKNKNQYKILALKKA